MRMRLNLRGNSFVLSPPGLPRSNLIWCQGCLSDKKLRMQSLKLDHVYLDYCTLCIKQRSARPPLIFSFGANQGKKTSHHGGEGGGSDSNKKRSDKHRPNASTCFQTYTKLKGQLLLNMASSLSSGSKKLSSYSHAENSSKSVSSSRL